MKIKVRECLSTLERQRQGCLNLMAPQLNLSVTPQVLVSWLELDEKRNPSLSSVLRHTGTCPHTHAQKCVNTHVHSECEKFQDGDRRWVKQDELTRNRPLHESGAHKLAPSSLGSSFSRLSLVCPVYSSRHKLSPGRMQLRESDVDICTLLFSS